MWTSASLVLLQVLSSSALSSYEVPKLNISVLEQNTYYVTIAWDVFDVNSTIETYEVIAENLEQGYRVEYQGPANIDIDKRISQVTVHKTDTVYNICLVGYLKEQAAIELNDMYTIEDCVETATIPILLPSSIIALSACGGFFVAMSIIGCFCWKVKSCTYKYRYHKYQQAQTKENGVNHKTTNSNVSHHIEA